MEPIEYSIYVFTPSTASNALIPNGIYMYRRYYDYLGSYIS